MLRVEAEAEATAAVAEETLGDKGVTGAFLAFGEAGVWGMSGIAGAGGGLDGSRTEEASPSPAAEGLFFFLLFQINPIKDPILSKISLLPPLPHIISNSLPLAVPQILHLVLRHQSPLHATVQVPFAQLSALGRVDPAGGFQASQVLFHQGLAFGVVV